MQINNIFKVDSYKFGHYLQYRPGTQYVSSYIEARGVEDGRNWDKVVVAGTANLVETLFLPRFCDDTDVEELRDLVGEHGPSFNYEGFMRLRHKHNGFLPVKVEALPEGTVVPLGTPILQVVNTDPEFYWLTSYLETQILRAIWYPSTVATNSFFIKKTIKQYMMETAGHIEGLDFKLHDFGSRGVSSGESAAIGGLGHLFSFQGTDTFEAIILARHLYPNTAMPAFSVDAAEHSTVTSFGREYETEAYRHLINKFGTKDKIFSIVSDSYNLWDAIENKYGIELKGEIEALKDKNAKLVVRPDSGDPTTVPVMVIQRLMDKFGYTINQKGYKVLPSYLGVLQGDGINHNSITTILENMKQAGLSAENIVFGMGGELLQKVNRDSLKFAMKASAAKNETFNNGEWYDVVKDPATDSGKRSKGGRLAVVYENGTYVTKKEQEVSDNNLLKCIYDGPAGYMRNLESLDNIRARVNAAL